MASGYSFAVEMDQKEVRNRLEGSDSYSFTTTTGETVVVYAAYVELLTESKSFYAGINLVPRGTAPEAPKERRPRAEKEKK